MRKTPLHASLPSIALAAALSLAACATPTPGPTPPAQTPAQPPSPAVAGPAEEAAEAMRVTCGSNPQNAEREINFVCSLQSTDLAHIEAGRAPVPAQGCPPTVACDIEDASLVVRILVSPATSMDNVPRAASVEITGFDKPAAHLSSRPLEGYGPWRPMTDAPVTPPLMHRGQGGKEFDLSPEATRRILALASALRQDPEPATWLFCKLNPSAGGDAQSSVVFSGDAAGAFIELYFGGETHAYLRSGGYFGKAGQIAALAAGLDRPETPCKPEGGG